MHFSTNITFSEKIGHLDILFFTKHLAIMIKSGIPITEAIDDIKQQTKNTSFQKVLAAVSKDVANGQSFEESLAKHPKVFDPFYRNLIRIGEESGNLEKNLDYLSIQLKKNYEFQKKVSGALLYPEIILVVTFIAGGAISFFVLPQLIDLFNQLNVKLPWTTLVLLFFANTMKNYGYIVFAGIVAFFFGFRAFVTLPNIKPHWHSFLLSIPIFGVFLQNVELGFFCRNVGVMLKSGLPITSALVAQYDATTNLVFKSYIKIVSDDVEKGKTISEALQESKFRFMPMLVIKMIGVGEKTGSLDESLAYLGDFFEDEIDEYSKDISTTLEPIMLVLVGLGVAFVAFAIISPIYQLSSGVH